MHQCDYCCWYNNRYSSCDCPSVIKNYACNKAQRLQKIAIKKLKENEARYSLQHV